jgi:SAM-dependent methyltransferase
MDPRDPASWRPKVVLTRRQRLGYGLLRVAGAVLKLHPITLEYAPPSPRERWGWGSAPNPALARLIDGAQPAFLETLELIARYGEDLARIPLSEASPGEPHWRQSWFTGLDAAALYSFIRARNPARFYEVGSGNSTLFAARAIRDGALKTRILSVDPSPRALIDAVSDEIVREPFQRTDPGRVAALEAGDVLLVDSSHYAMKDSDVVALIFDVLPELPPGVLVGFHDIFLPDDYPWWFSGRWYSEQYLLGAWLLGKGEGTELRLADHRCLTEPSLRARVDEVWAATGIPGELVGTAFWFET